MGADLDADFDYDAAFSRNIGWLTRNEQRVLKTKRIAIAGMGGVGGRHLLALTRLGIGGFNIADFDIFDIVNFNRQAGATVSNIGKSKVLVLAGMAHEINPELNIQQFPEGVNELNVHDFLRNVDLYVDGLNFFAIAARRLVFEACHRLNIPAITAAPLGMGAAVLVFMPGRMSFEQYFCLDGCDEEEMFIRFLLGLSPAMLQRGYLVDPTQVDFIKHKGPSTGAACQLCAGLAAVEALKVLLERGGVYAVPWGYQFDAYCHRLVKTWRPWGNRNMLQKIALRMARKQLEYIKNRSVGS